MAEKLDLTNDIADALNTATERGRSPVLGYLDVDGDVSVSFRGSTHVYGPQQIAIWARKRDEGLAAAVGRHPQVSLVYFSPEGPGPRHIQISGRAHVDPDASARVYEAMFAGERGHDPDRNGVAVIVEVDRVRGVRGDEHFELRRDGDPAAG